MADAPEKVLKITIVTPEKAVLDAAADMVILPMHDGELGVLPGRAPFVGQLGPGELRIKTGTATERYFLDGGFVQVRTNTINVLTPVARRANELTDAMIQAERGRAEALPQTNAVEKATRDRALLKVKGMEKVRARTGG